MEQATRIHSNQTPKIRRTQICDALLAEEFKKDDTVIKQGESGDKFYIIESGDCIATKKTDGGADKDMKLGAGDYFGELSLLNNDPRAASIKVVSDNAKLLVLERSSFARLLGPLRDVLLKAKQRYA